jgi:hypothetical protein
MSIPFTWTLENRLKLKWLPFLGQKLTKTRKAKELMQKIILKNFVLTKHQIEASQQWTTTKWSRFKILQAKEVTKIL